VSAEHDLLRITEASHAVRGAAGPSTFDDRTYDRLRGHVAIVTGAARGQGAATARLLAAEGAQVVVTDVLAEGADVADELGDAGLWAELDVGSEDQWAEVVARAEAQFGPVTVLVNNAGWAFVGLIEELSLDDYLAVVRTNQVGTFLGIRAVIPSMARAGRGSIINVSSIDGLAAHPGIAGYVSSKFAIRGLTKVAALELGARGIRVNCIHPGAIDTPMLRPEGAPPEAFAALAPQIPVGRVADPDEVARVTVFLASDDARYVTGVELPVDGGVMAKVPLGPS
jgi:3alpha(or 20beta)-hydroxysteroid dehydrogenase